MCGKRGLESQWIGDFGNHNGPLLVQERKIGLLPERIREEEVEKQKFQKCGEG